MELVGRGAEACIYRTRWLGSDAILKVRRPRGYADPALDSRLRRRRTAREAQMLCHAKAAGVPAPLVYFADPARSSITMQRIPGRLVRDLPGPEVARLSRAMGRLAGMMHRGGMVHGDLTTSNFVLSGGALFAIDFGLSHASARPEDHAVDLRLIREILNSAHAAVMARAWRGFSAGYRQAVGAAACSRIMGIVSEIEGRGRYATVV